jgi:cysteine desulfurase
MGVGPDAIRSTIRFGLGRFNTGAEVDKIVNAVANAVTQLRQLK